MTSALTPTTRLSLHERLQLRAIARGIAMLVRRFADVLAHAARAGVAHVTSLFAPWRPALRDLSPHDIAPRIDAHASARVTTTGPMRGSVTAQAPPTAA